MGNGYLWTMMDLNKMTEEAVALLCRMIATPSVSRDESAVASVVESYLSDKGLDYTRLGNNLIVRSKKHDESKPTLLMNAHLDTVKPTDSWTRDPFEATVEGDVIHGLGANDDGASVVSLLQAFMLLEDTDQTYNRLLVLSAEEEVSGKGGIESVLPTLPRISVALVGEPTGMQPATAEKGLMVLDVTAHGKAGHAARNEGDNAIYRAMDDMQWFRTARLPLQTDLLGPVKMTVTIVNAGTQHNVIPAECTFTVDVRSNECYSNEEIFDIVMENVHSDVKARSFRLNSSHISKEHPLVKRCIGMGLKPFGSPTLSDQALMHFPSMKMGPGQSSRSHSADEFVLVSEIREAILLYYELLNGLSMTRG